MAFFQKLQEEKSSFCTKEQLVKLETSKDLLFDLFLWKSKDSYLKLFVILVSFDRRLRAIKTRLQNEQIILANLMN
jgi:hypothetical protein